MGSSVHVLETAITTLMAIAAIGLLGFFSRRTFGLKSISLIGFLGFLTLSVHSEKFLVTAFDNHSNVYLIAQEPCHDGSPVFTANVQNDKKGHELYFIETEEEDNQLSLKKLFKASYYKHSDFTCLSTGNNFLTDKFGFTPFESLLHNSNRYQAFISVFII